MTAAHARAILAAVGLAAVALVWRQPDLLVIGSPFAAVAAWSLLDRPVDTPQVSARLGNTTLREGDATQWHGAIRDAPGVDVVAATMRPMPWVDHRPASGAISARVLDGRADLRIGVRSLRWGERAVEPVDIVLATTWGAFRWSCVTGRLALTTLPLPAIFDADASARPSDGLVGVHRSSRQGEGNEFAGMRRFRAGDRMRRINWPRSVRSGELQVNATWSDLDTHIALVLDATDDYGASDGIDGRASSLDGSVRAAGAIAEHYALRGERVSLRIVGSAAKASLTPASGQTQLRRVLDTLASVRASDVRRTGARNAAVNHVAPVGGQMTIMLSPLISPDVLDLAVSMGRQGASVIVVDTLPDHVTTDDDAYTALAWRVRLLERRRELRHVLATGIPVVEWRGPGSLDQVIRDVSHRSSAPRMVRR
ncbi:MAG: DUF58 domain-containing protein [Ilumatobacteraceae bacterium]